MSLRQEFEIIAFFLMNSPNSCSFYGSIKPRSKNGGSIDKTNDSLTVRLPSSLNGPYDNQVRLENIEYFKNRTALFFKAYNSWHRTYTPWPKHIKKPSIADRSEGVESDIWKAVSKRKDVRNSLLNTRSQYRGYYVDAIVQVSEKL